MKSFSVFDPKLLTQDGSVFHLTLLLNSCEEEAETELFVQKHFRCGWKRREKRAVTLLKHNEFPSSSKFNQQQTLEGLNHLFKTDDMPTEL